MRVRTLLTNQSGLSGSGSHAKSSNTDLLVGALELVDERGQQTSSSGSKGVTAKRVGWSASCCRSEDQWDLPEGNGSSLGVDLLGIETELLDHHEGLRSEGCKAE